MSNHVENHESLLSLPDHPCPVLRSESKLSPDDHRALGQRMDLFHFQDEAPGMVFWHPRGFAAYRRLEDYLRARLRGEGYVEVRTPQLLDRSIWEASGHWANFSEHMIKFEGGDRVAALKPVSCPGHVQVFNHGLRSFRELPLRLAELGACHRDEQSGALHGLMRLRAFVQDDAHIFCSEDQIDEEVARFCRLLWSFYGAFGFERVSVALALRPPVRAGSDEIWDHAERALGAAARAAGIAYEEHPGDGAFYGPKLEFVLHDARGRAWQCGTIQLDLVIPDRMGASYVDRDGRRARPVMLHRAICGSLERFFGIVLEHSRGALPAWLAPEAVAVCAVSEEVADYAREVVAALRRDGADVHVPKEGTLSRKLVDARELGVPFVFVLGRREREARAVALRRPDGSSELLPLAEALARVRAALVGPGVG
ncbi:MAG: threonine--tRNA ligase [Myxococcales bacterium]|nr:threonine--tRNA ligase [Myxococcales bacterium]